MEDDSEAMKLSGDMNRYRQLLNVCTDEKTMEILNQLIEETQARLDEL